MVSYWSSTVQAPANWTNPAIGVTLNQIQTDLAGGPRWWGWAWHGYLDGKWDYGSIDSRGTRRWKMGCRESQLIWRSGGRFTEGLGVFHRLLRCHLWPDTVERVG